MATSRGQRSGRWAPVVATLCVLLAACGGDDPGGSPGAAGTPAGTPGAGSGSSATPAREPGTGSEYCDRLLAAMESVGGGADAADLGFEELAGRLVAELREVEPYAPGPVADDLDVFIGYYEQVAAGELANLDGGEDFLAATKAVFGECAAAPVMPPIGP